jgi:hypothetical protein
MPAPGTNKWEEALGLDEKSQAEETLKQEFEAKEAAAINAEAADDTVNVPQGDALEAAKKDLNFLSCACDARSLSVSISSTIHSSMAANAGSIA